MTREEAFNRIDAIIEKHEVDDVYVTITNFKDYDALRMARELLEQKPCEDAISRQAVLDGIDTYINKAQSIGTQDDFYSFAELVVKELPPVTPQEPFMNKPCVAHQVCHEDKVKVLDEISAEIEEAQTYDGIYIDRAYVLQIIDKYKTESEE